LAGSQDGILRYATFVRSSCNRESYEILAKRIEKVLVSKGGFERGAFGHLEPIQKSPKVRIVNLICPIPFARIEESGKRYRQYINMLYEASIEDAANNLESFSLSDTDVPPKTPECFTYAMIEYPEKAVWIKNRHYDESNTNHITNYPYAVNDDWIRAAREALPPGKDDEILYTEEWDREVHARYDANCVEDDLGGDPDDVYACHGIDDDY
jgi:hypothetical protein